MKWDSKYFLKLFQIIQLQWPLYHLHIFKTSRPYTTLTETVTEANIITIQTLTPDFMNIFLESDMHWGHC